MFMASDTAEDAWPKKPVCGMSLACGTGKSFATIRGARIATVINAHLYDLNGNSLGRLGANGDPLPPAFKELLEHEPPRKRIAPRIGGPREAKELHGGKKT